MTLKGSSDMAAKRVIFATETAAEPATDLQRSENSTVVFIKKRVESNRQYKIELDDHVNARFRRGQAYDDFSFEFALNLNDPMTGKL